MAATEPPCCIALTAFFSGINKKEFSVAGGELFFITRVERGGKDEKRIYLMLAILSVKETCP